MEWIDLKKKQPSYKEHVLVWEVNPLKKKIADPVGWIQVAYLESTIETADKKIFAFEPTFDMNADPLYHVTHWAPLPKPPKSK